MIPYTGTSDNAFYLFIRLGLNVALTHHIRSYHDNDNEENKRNQRGGSNWKGFANIRKGPMGHNALT